MPGAWGIMGSKLPSHYSSRTHISNVHSVYQISFQLKITTNVWVQLKVFFKRANEYSATVTAYSIKSCPLPDNNPIWVSVDSQTL